MKRLPTSHFSVEQSNKKGHQAYNRFHFPELKQKQPKQDKQNKLQKDVFF